MGVTESLEELVVGSLPSVEQETEPFRPRHPIEIGSERASFQDLIGLCQSFRTDIVRSPQLATEKLLQLAIYLENRPPIPHMFFGPERRLSRLIVCSMSPYGDELEELLEWSRVAERRLHGHMVREEEMAIMGNVFAQLEYLRDFFGDDIEDELCAVTDVRPATVRRWLAGGSTPSWVYSQRIKLLAQIIFAARRTGQMSDVEIRDWYETPNPRSVRELVGVHVSIHGEELRAALAKIDFSFQEI